LSGFLMFCLSCSARFYSAGLPGNDPTAAPTGQKSQ